MSRRTHDNTARRGFTLVEVIVAIGLLALVGVIVGTIFASVGDTVTQGRQVSNLNRFAARVERVMRRDFDNMVRENGFLVIRNELTHNYGGANPELIEVALSPTDPTFGGDDNGDGNAQPGRPRRIDEIMFFSRGDFTSRRTPLHREMLAQSSTARIYYGHGQRRPEDFGTNVDSPDYTTAYARPRVDDPNLIEGARLGLPGSLAQANPNEYAADWALLRHVTLLVPRSSGLQVLPDNVFGITPNEQGNLAGYNAVADSSIQVALGPAAQGVFRSVSQMTPYEIASHPASDEITVIGQPGFSIRPINGFANIASGNLNDGAPGFDESLARPHFSSGIVDVAVTDLDEIRAFVTSPWYSPNLTVFAELGPRGVTPYDYSTVSGRFGIDRARRSYDDEGRRMVGTALRTNINAADHYGPTSVPRPQTQQLWMLDALPGTPYAPSEPNLTGYRMRYESIPPRVYLDSGAINLNDDERLTLAIEQADQEMLASSIFLPRCTEFIVEWSLGIIDRRDPDENPNYGQPIWHGLRRFIDRDGDGRYDPGYTAGDDVLLADLFRETWGDVDLVDLPDQQDDDFAIREVLGDWAFEDGNLPINNDPGGLDAEMFELVRVDQRFDNSEAALPVEEDAIAAEYAFGYFYQDWNEDADGDNTFDNDEDDVVRPWPWPRLIRVTMRYVDPSDPDTERTYQAEFRVPSPSGEM